MSAGVPTAGGAGSRERQQAGGESLTRAGGGTADRWQALATAYAPRVRAELAGSIVPFWQRTLDPVRGGVFNCWNNAGTRLISRDKFTWSQGRFLWMWSRLAEATRRGLLPGSADEFVDHARKTLHFLQAHAFLADGRCAFLLSEAGEPKEVAAGLGLAPSIYADCFVAMGFAEFARVTRDRAVLGEACSLLDRIERRMAAGNCPTHPAPIPEGYQGYALAMIFLNVTLVVRAACEELDAADAGRARERSVAAAGHILGSFVGDRGWIAEYRSRFPGAEDTLLCRHTTPGHALEGAWMLLTIAARERRAEWLARAAEVVRFALGVGWDELHGGLLYRVDREGGGPRGTAIGAPGEQAIVRNWDAKLWWVHSEALYASLLCHRLTGDEAARTGFEQVLAYAFRVFPHPDPAVGEWIQIRNRRGEPVDAVVALPVKDPYHLTRNLIQVLELLSSGEPVLPP
jgi:N-acylglucosamine 2-epimerase